MPRGGKGPSTGLAGAWGRAAAGAAPSPGLYLRPRSESESDAARSAQAYRASSHNLTSSPQLGD